MSYKLVIKLLNLVIYLANKQFEVKSAAAEKLFALAAKAEVEAKEAFDDANGAATLARKIEALLK